MFLNQLIVNGVLFFVSICGLVLNRKSIILTLMCIELMLLSVNLNFLLFSYYLDDLYGQIFALIILTVAASESSIGLALIIVYYRIRGGINITQQVVLRN